MKTSPEDRDRIREVIQIAKNARECGNRPCGAFLVAADGTTLAIGENSQITDKQILAHAEMNLLHEAVQRFSSDVLAASTLYTSAEPCAMCAGAIFWSGIGRLVFGLRGERLHELAGFTQNMLVASSQEVLRHAGREVEVVGSVIESEAEALFADGVF